MQWWIKTKQNQLRKNQQKHKNGMVAHWVESFFSKYKMTCFGGISDEHAMFVYLSNIYRYIT